MVVSTANSGSNITGSWHNSGYYGHFRNRVRSDFMNEYRQRAKPTPPQKYLERSKAPVRKHMFSKHDSRERYKDNALYFVDGNGRRQVHETFSQYKPEFIAWMPHRKELIEQRQPLTSVYKMTFHQGTRGYGSDPLSQRYSSRIASQAPRISQKFDSRDDRSAFTDGYTSDPLQRFQTTYKKVHCTKDDRADQARYINTISYESANSQKIERARSARPGLHRESVASCLSWAPHRSYTTVPEAQDIKPINSGYQKLGRTTLEATPIVAPTAVAPAAVAPAAVAPAAKTSETALSHQMPLLVC